MSLRQLCLSLLAYIPTPYTQQIIHILDAHQKGLNKELLFVNKLSLPSSKTPANTVEVKTLVAPKYFHKQNISVYFNEVQEDIFSLLTQLNWKGIENTFGQSPEMNIYMRTR